MKRLPWLALLAGCTAAPPPRDATSFWLETCARHGFTQAETAMATGLEAKDVARRGVPAAPPPPFTILPYPGVRHPRVGFLDGAIDPHRDTKFSLFLPGGGYAVIDFPEAVWADKELQYLAHTHIPTAWDKKGVKLPRMDWTRTADGLEATRVLPDGLEFHARVAPSDRGAKMELRLKNGSDRKRTALRAQVCVMLKGAPGFTAQTKDNKRHLPDAVCAARSDDGRRWLAVVFEGGKTWDNPPCPCIHSDPTFPDLAPGEEAVARGRVWYAEGEEPPTR
ncbi:MAG TPA: hypothetical protein VF950_24765 [Planctomycetota bacterium]